MTVATRARLFVRPVLLATLMMFAAVGSAGAITMTGKSSGPKPGGTITLGGTPSNVLDFTQSGFIAANATQVLNVYGDLFLNPINPGGAFMPDLAQSYSFNKASTQFTVTLKKGLKFSDGTPLNAAAVAWNWSTARDDGAVAVTNQYMGSVSSVVTKGKYTVVVTFSQPDAVWISDIAQIALGFMASPTAYANQGASQFDLTPVGAGAFKIQSDTATQTIVMVKNPDYWDAKHVYLSSITYINTGTDTTSNYNDLQSNAISELGLSGTSSSPTVIQQAYANPNFAHRATPNYNFLEIPINTHTAPFNNQLAREALDYCMDRSTLAQYTAAGYATPAWVFAGPAEFWFPEAGGKPSLQAAQKLMPYQYNVSMGTSIVNQLGGLSFQWTMFSGQQVVYATAIQAEWAQCGIKASINLVAPQNLNSLITAGNYQAVLTFGGGTYDPRLYTTFLNPTASLDIYGFSDPTVTADLTASFATTNTTKLKKLWTQIWSTMDKDAVLIPVFTAPGYLVYNKCIQGQQYNFGTVFTHAWLSC